MTAAVPSRRAVPGLLLSLLLIVLSTVPVSRASAQMTDADSLRAVRFRTSAFQVGVVGRSVSGQVGWVTGEDGAVRVEVALDDHAEGPGSLERRRADRLLTRRGNGWTIALGRAGQGTLNAWGREWRSASPELEQLVRETTATLDDEAERGRRKVVLNAAPDAESAVDRGFRNAMTRRGRGGGGPGEVFIIDGGDDLEQGVTVHSSRRPGRLRVTRPTVRAARAPIPEVFLPLWPLSDLLDFSASGAGTSGSVGG